MRKLLIFLIIITASIILQVPSKTAYKLLPLFLRFKYGISTSVGEIKGGFKEGIVITDIKLNRGSTSVKCEKVSTNIKFLDFIFQGKESQHSIYINKPRILVGNSQSQSNGFLGIPFWPNISINISDGELSVSGLGDNLPILFSGVVSIKQNSIGVNNLRVLLGELELEMEGGLDNNRYLNLSAHFTNSEKWFLVKGPLNKPQISTEWGGLKTLFQVENIKYDNGQLILPRIAGNIYIEGFPTIDFDGGICIDKGFIKLNNMTILKDACIDGVISKNRPSRIKLCMDNVSGVSFAKNLPEVLRILIFSHKVSTDINIYGMMGDLQAGGLIKLLSTPIEIACRYRKNKFSFRSIGEGPFNIYGSINWNNIPSLFIRGIVREMDIKEFTALLGKEVNDKWEGIVNGEFSFTGGLEDPLVESKLEITDADFGNIVFDAAYLNLQGHGSGPLNLLHSMIYYKEIPAELTGFIDPKEKDIFKNIEIRPNEEGFIWEGLNIIKDDKGKVVSFGKDVNENISVHFKSIITSDSEESGEEKKPEVELEYKLRDDKNLLLKMQEDEGTVGVEHKVKF